MIKELEIASELKIENEKLRALNAELVEALNNFVEKYDFDASYIDVTNYAYYVYSKSKAALSKAKEQTNG
jgi:hypothetical protein